MPRYVLSLKKAEDSASVGVKAYVLGLLFRDGFPVPDGFLVNNKAYRTFLVSNKLESRILDLYNSANITNYEEIIKLSQEIKNMIMNAPIPDDVREEITQAYKFMNIGEVAPVETIDILRAGKEQFRVIVRPSVDSKFNFPGLFAYGEGVGVKRVLDLVKEVWASLHNTDAILYRSKLHINHDMDMSLIIQRQIENEKSGIAITAKKTIIESTWGMNKAILNSNVHPDRFVIEENTIVSKQMGKKRITMIRDEIGNSKLISSGSNSEKMSVSDNEVLKINSMIKKIESIFKTKIICEWAIDGHKLYLLQCRSHNFGVELPPEMHTDSLIKGLPVSHGYTSGKTRFSYEPGSRDIIVSDKPSSKVCMLSSAVVCEFGSYGSSDALLCREMGVPALFDAEHATKLIKENQKATLDCYEGCLHIFENDAEIKTIVKTRESNKGFWIDTPAAALTLKGIEKDDIVFFDIEKTSRLMFGSDYSEEAMSHDSIIEVIRRIVEKCNNVFVFWRKEPEDYILVKLSELKIKNIFQVMSKDVI